MANDKDNILDELDPYLRKRYESELSHIFEDLEKDDNLGKAVEQICNDTDDLDEIQSKLILVIKEHLKTSRKSNLKVGKEVSADEEKIAKDITEFCRTVMQNLDENIEPELGRISHKDRAHLLNAESKKNLKRVIKSFMIYQVYKVMNPKRIAGETSKDNYQHNLIYGGQKLASKYEGGKESDLKKYGSAEVNRMQRQASSIKRDGGGFSR